MIKYEPGHIGLIAKVENIKTREKFVVSTVRNPYGIYETAVKTSSSIIATLGFSASNTVFVVNSSTQEESQRNHIRTAELFEQLNPEDLIKKYKIEGEIGSQLFMSEDAKEPISELTGKNVVSVLVEKLDLSGFYKDSNEQLRFILSEGEREAVENLFKMQKDMRWDPDYAEEVENGFTACGLFDYARDELSRIKIDSYREGEKKEESIKNAITAILKAYHIYRLPIFLYDLGCCLEMIDMKSEAKNILKIFLDLQTSLKLTPLAKGFLVRCLEGNMLDIETAIKDATVKLME